MPTTLLVKNIPKEYSLGDLCGHWTPDGSYDLLHYPCNVRTRRRLGFCFVNFLSGELASEFRLGWHGRTFSDPRSTRPLEVTSARRQGVMATLEFFRGYRSELITDDELVPALFQGARRLHTRTVLEGLGIISWSDPDAREREELRSG